MVHAVASWHVIADWSLLVQSGSATHLPSVIAMLTFLDTPTKHILHLCRKAVARGDEV